MRRVSIDFQVACSSSSTAVNCKYFLSFLLLYRYSSPPFYAATNRHFGRTVSWELDGHVHDTASCVPKSQSPVTAVKNPSTSLSRRFQAAAIVTICRGRCTTARIRFLGSKTRAKLSQRSSPLNSTSPPDLSPFVDPELCNCPSTAPCIPSFRPRSPMEVATGYFLLPRQAVSTE
jgi:hypothetical protein